MKPITAAAALACSMLVSTSASAATIFAVDGAGRLVTFDSAAPTVTLSTTAITGTLGLGIGGIDFRPATGQLFALGFDKSVLTINTTTGAATTVAGPVTGLTGNNFGFDFNPTVDRIRLVSDSGQNFRLNPSTGAIAATDTAYTYTGGAAASITGVGYTNSILGATTTNLYGIDYQLNTLALIGSPNGGTITTVGGLGFDVGADASFDIATTGEAYLSSGTGFYSVSLQTGAATLIGNPGALRGIAIAGASAVPEPASWAMMIVGVGVVGGAARYRRRSTKVSFA